MPAPVHTVVRALQLRVALLDQVDDRVDGGGVGLPDPRWSGLKLPMPPEIMRMSSSGASSKA
jgi:hypothetical protein